MGFEALGRRALDTASTRGAHYADIRFENVHSERIEVRNGVVATLADGRAPATGSAPSSTAPGDSPRRDLIRCRRRCDRGARGRNRPGQRRDRARRFGEAPLHALRRSLRDADRTRSARRSARRTRRAAPRSREARARSGRASPSARAWIDLWRTEKYFYSTIGSAIEQAICQTGSGLQAMAVGDGDVQTRTFPGDIGLYKPAAGRSSRKPRLRENAQRIGEEASALLSAPQCPSGTFDIILGGSQVSLQIHESCGHPAELDRVMGWEANFSGTSFLEVDQLGKLKYGSPTRHDRHRQHAAARHGDVRLRRRRDEIGQSDIVRDGVLAGYEMSNDTARTIGRESNACVRAQSWEFVPMIRMCNLNLCPGNVPFEGLFDGVKDGVYMESNRSWSIDDRRLNFQFGCEIGWEIKNGKRGRMLKNPTYAGMTPQFWNSCDAIADEDRGSRGERRTAARASRCRPGARRRPPRPRASAT